VITQNILNFLRDLLVAIISLFPPLPAEWNQAFTSAAVGMSAIANTIAKLDPIIPFPAIVTAIGVFSLFIAYWVIVLTVRFILWAINR
jgi:hypothetical protein